VRWAIQQELMSGTKIMAKARDFIHFLIDYGGVPQKARVRAHAVPWNKLPSLGLSRAGLLSD
jgi:hypothetical protein